MSTPMEPSIWGHLPADLIDRIIAFLPLSTIFSLRPTSKHFNSLLVTPSFLSLLPHSSTPSFLLLSHPQFSHHSLPLYDPSAASWRSLPLPSPSHHLLAAASGLLCFSLPARRSAILLANLLTHCTKILPLPAIPGATSNGAITLVPLPSARPHGYKLFLAGRAADAVFLYDSASDKWARFRSCLPGAQEGVVYDGSLYFATAEPFSVVAFGLGSGAWDAAAAPPVPAELAFARLVGDGGQRLFLVGGVGRDGISRSLKVWELVTGKWEEVGRLPEMMCRKFVSVCYHNYGHVHCLWHQGMVCVCCTTWPEVLFYKVGRRTWHWLPRCPMLPEKWSCGFRWFSFVPDLYALV